MNVRLSEDAPKRACFGAFALRSLSAMTLLFSLAAMGVAQTKPASEPKMRDLQSDTWTATDALGRTLPGFEECGAPRQGKYVGVFYFLWLDKQHDTGLFDNSRLLAANPTNPQYGPKHAFHWWGEPHLGYYFLKDTFVVRKHAQMLTDAGVDVLFLDVTNALTYDETLDTLCRTLEEIRKTTGRPVPQIAFLANSAHVKTVQHLYDTFYAKKRYPALWFRWQGKPLLLTPTDGLSPEVHAFFTLRQSWAWSDPRGWFGDGKEKWCWVDHYPQQPGWRTQKDKPEQISVSSAQHATTNIGRSFHNGKQPAQPTPEVGLCFAEQWRRALEVDPEFVFITGWNEWVAMRFLNEGGIHFLGRPLEKGETFFVDQYNQEYSRDIEPMRGGHGDAYYYQMVANIRRFKGVRPTPKASPPRAIRLDAGFRQWNSVAPRYLDDIQDTTHRNYPQWGGGKTYVNTTGRNDFEALKVARDAENLYFYAIARAPITAPTEPTWMNLLLNTDGNARNGWEGYDFAVRYLDGAMTLCRNAGGWKWEPMQKLAWKTAGRELHLAIPRGALGLEPGRGKLRLEFKWTDNASDSGDILDFIDQGDVAPNGRFNYRYEE